MANKPQLKTEGPKKAKTCVVLAHGAGESSASSFLSFFAEQLVARRHRVVRFDFPYMAERSRTGRKRPPDPEPVLRQAWLDVIGQLDDERIAIGGKSMGGRMASLVFEESRADGLICLGYPFHPTGRPEKLRVEHLADIAKPMLIVQGERDPFGDRTEVEAYALPASAQLHWAPDGDHSYSPPRGSSRTHEQNLKNAGRAVQQFLFHLWPGFVHDEK